MLLRYGIVQQSEGWSSLHCRENCQITFPAAGPGCLALGISKGRDEIAFKGFNP